jgi:hypothetical protein
MLKWTKEKPTEIGWYWKKGPNYHYPPEIVYVCEYVGELCIQKNWKIPDYVYWAGPIPEPK